MGGVIESGNKRTQAKSACHRVRCVSLLALGALGLSILGGCKSVTGEGATDSVMERSSADSGSSMNVQAWVDTQARTLQIQYRVLANRGDGGCHLDGESGTISNPCSEVHLHITAPQRMEAEVWNRNWSIYFSQTDPTHAAYSSEFSVEHINGDLHRIRPTQSFTGFKPGETKILPFIVNGLTLTEAKIMPNYYLVVEGEAVHSQARVIESTRIVIDPETGLEVRPFAGEIHPENFKLSKADKTPYADSAFLFNENQVRNVGGFLTAKQAANSIIPTPVKQELGQGRVDLSSGINVMLRGVEEAELATALQRLASFGVVHTKSGFPINVHVRKRLTEQQVEGSYSLEVTPTEINISSSSAVGAFYAVQSLAGLLAVESQSVPVVRIADAPRYGYRGMHIDVGRNFHSKSLMVDVLDQMAAYKLNKLHLHLGEDEGWRLQIPDLPELTDVGGKRCHDPEENTCLLMQLGADVSGTSARDGYYTRDEYIELVKEAQARHIQLIPSFDMPGHSRAAVKSMEARYRRFMAQGNRAAAEEYLLSDFGDTTQYQSIQFYSDNTINACMESPYHFLGKVIDEVQAMHLEAGQPLTVYHIGADETAGAWKDSPVCKTFFESNPYGVSNAKQLGPYFIQRVAGLLSEKGIITAGWSDGLSHTNPEKMPKKVQSNIWDVLPWAGVKEANTQANRGWDVVLSNPDALYFDFPYEPDPKEGGYYWGSRHIDTHKVFSFMPGNLPVLAEIYPNPTQTEYRIEDTAPLQAGVQWAGIQGQLWSETVRSDDAVEYMVFPRLLALAERAWHAPSWEPAYRYQGGTYGASEAKQVFNTGLQSNRDADWLRFASVLGHKEFAKLDAADVEYRIPTVGAKIEAGTLYANLPYPGLAIEYKAEGGTWRRYSGPIAVSGRVSVRAIAPDGIRRGRALEVTP